ncbi:MAG TPA: GGDEF domain-containing protein [Solirubrobacteraceae bacterium]|nr:GGDEF domain-containing protein [Solirubrobacteraceae bacterium]
MSESERELRNRIAELERALEQARREAGVDELTGALNRRGWERLLASEEERCARHGLDAVIVTLDLDELKATNDAAGHAAGDRLISACADALRSTVRAEDAVARTGGDEFAVLAVQTTEGRDVAVQARIADALKSASVKATLGSARRVESRTLRQAWQRADQRMIAAKAAKGRGR